MNMFPATRVIEHLRNLSLHVWNPFCESLKNSTGRPEYDQLVMRKKHYSFKTVHNRMPYAFVQQRTPYAPASGHSYRLNELISHAGNNSVLYTECTLYGVPSPPFPPSCALVKPNTHPAHETPFHARGDISTAKKIGPTPSCPPTTAGAWRTSGGCSRPTPSCPARRARPER